MSAVLLIYSALIPSIIAFTLLEIEQSNDYEYKTWGSVKEKAAIIYDRMAISDALKLMTESFDDSNEYIIYTGIGLQYIEDADAFGCYYVRDKKKYEFAHIIPDAKKYYIIPAYQQRFQPYLMDRISYQVQQLAKRRPKQYKTRRYAFVFKKDKEGRVEYFVYPQRIDVAPRLKKEQLPKTGWIKYKPMDWMPQDEKLDAGPIDYGQVDNPKIIIEPEQNGQNALSIFDAHGYRIFSRATTHQSDWRPNTFFGFDDLDSFEHKEKNIWIRHSYAHGEGADEFLQHVVAVFDKDGFFRGFETDGPAIVVEKEEIHESYDPKESGVYKSHQGFVGDCVLHAVNALLGGPFWNNKEFRTFGKKFTGSKKEKRPEDTYRTDLFGRGEEFGSIMVEKALKSVGCETFHLTIKDIVNQKYREYGDQENGEPRFLGFEFSYYASRKKKEDAHAIAWVYRPKGKGHKGEEGFWYVQSWAMHARRWFNIGNAVRYLNEWKTAKEKGFFEMLHKTRIYEWVGLVGFVVVDEGMYQTALDKARKKKKYKEQFALLGYANMYTDGQEYDEYDEGDHDFEQEQGEYTEDQYNEDNQDVDIIDHYYIYTDKQRETANYSVIALLLGLDAIVLVMMCTGLCVLIIGSLGWLYYVTNLKNNHEINFI